MLSISYVSYLTEGDFSGHVYDGYLREGDPTGPKIEFKDGRIATYDFSNRLRRFVYGAQMGISWRALCGNADDDDQPHGLFRWIGEDSLPTCTASSAGVGDVHDDDHRSAFHPNAF